MLQFVLLLLVAPSRSVELVDDEFNIPGGDWRYVEVTLNQPPVTVDCRFHVASGASGARLYFTERDELEGFRAGDVQDFLAAAAPGNSGGFRYQVRAPGKYVIIVDNRKSAASSAIRLRVSLDFGNTSITPVRTLTPQRRLAVILISFAVFFAIAGWSGRRLIRALSHWN